LTNSPIVSQSPLDGFAVVPVVEYEPPTRSTAERHPTSPAPLPAASPRRTSCAPHRPYRRQSEAAPSATPVMSAPMRQAAMFADAALRRVLEVIDRRRSVAQLRPLLAPSLVDSVPSLGRSAAGHEGAAVLRRVGLQLVAQHGPETAAEVFGSYSRGHRVHAIACRVEEVATGNGTRWQVVALHIG
jgi:hypothetical protein